MKQLLNAIFYKPVLNLLVAILAFLPNHNLGLAIIIITLAIRLALYSVSLSTIKSQQKMREIQPELKRIQERYKYDKQHQTEEMLKLYRERKVNPYGSCLPLFIQFAFLIALYSAFKQDLIHLPTNDLYSFTPKLSQVDTTFFGLELTQKPDISWPLSGSALGVIILALLAAGLQFWQTKMLLPKTQKGVETDPTTAATQNMLYFMPLFTLWISFSLPVALPLYWVVTTLFSIGQQYWFIKRGHIEHPSAALIKELGPKTEEVEPKVIESKGKNDVKIRVRRKE